jgi:hypothetical protein
MYRGQAAACVAGMSAAKPQGGGNAYRRIVAFGDSGVVFFLLEVMAGIAKWPVSGHFFIRRQFFSKARRR